MKTWSSMKKVTEWNNQYGVELSHDKLFCGELSCDELSCGVLTMASCPGPDQPHLIIQLKTSVQKSYSKQTILISYDRSIVWSGKVHEFNTEVMGNSLKLCKFVRETKADMSETPFHSFLPSSLLPLPFSRSVYPPLSLPPFLRL